MGSYKHIEFSVGSYVAGHYRRAVEAGIGNNTLAAEMLAEKGILMGCTDIRCRDYPASLHFSCDDIFMPDLSLYRGADVVYALRPAIEMIPPLMAIARAVESDLVVYHLGFEMYGDGGERLDCGIILHRYVRRSEPVKEG